MLPVPSPSLPGQAITASSRCRSTAGTPGSGKRLSLLVLSPPSALWVLPEELPALLINTCSLTQHPRWPRTSGGFSGGKIPHPRCQSKRAQCSRRCQGSGSEWNLPQQQLVPKAALCRAEFLLSLLLWSSSRAEGRAGLGRGRGVQPMAPCLPSCASTEGSDLMKNQQQLLEGAAGHPYGGTVPMVPLWQLQGALGASSWNCGLGWKGL